MAHLPLLLCTYKAAVETLDAINPCKPRQKDNSKVLPADKIRVPAKCSKEANTEGEFITQDSSGPKRQDSNSNQLAEAKMLQLNSERALTARPQSETGFRGLQTASPPFSLVFISFSIWLLQAGGGRGV